MILLYFSSNLPLDTMLSYIMYVKLQISCHALFKKKISHIHINSNAIWHKKALKGIRLRLEILFNKVISFTNSGSMLHTLKKKKINLSNQNSNLISINFVRLIKRFVNFQDKRCQMLF